MSKMAALECNNGQDGFSPTENGETHPDDRSQNIDYSEDLWLANGEDSSGPYAQQPRKVVAQEQPCSYSCQSEVGGSYPNSYVGHSSQDSQSGDGVSEPQVTNPHSQVWSEGLPDDDATMLQPATSYMNGLVEQNGVDFDSSGEEKDFAQLVPAGSYVENGGTEGVDNQDKTFTSLMPAAAVGESEDLQQDYTSMIGSHQQQMVYYGSGDQMTTDPTSPMVTSDNPTISYGQALQMATVGREKSGSRDEGSNAVYISMDSLNASNQTVASGGDFTVLSPAMIRLSNVNSNRQPYISKMTDGSYQHISTLPFVQNGTYSTQTSFASYHSATTPSSASNGGDRQQPQGIQQSDYSSDQTSFSSCEGTALTVGSTLTPSIQTNVVEYQEEDEDDERDDDEDPNQDMEDDSVEFSEFCCPVCSEAFVDQSTLDDHVNNHPPLKTFVCETCSKGFATRRYLKYHRKNHCKRAGSYEGRNEFDENDPSGGAKRFACNVCNRPFRVLKCMKVHKKKKHDIVKDYTCQNCTVTFNSSHELLDHPCQTKSVPVTPQVEQSTPPPLVLPTQKKKKKLKNARPTCDICGKTFSDRISVDIHRVKHIEEELYPCDMCDENDGADAANHLAVHFRIRFFTDDNQHILEDQKAAVVKSDDGSSVPPTPVHNPDYATPQSAPATPVYHPATPTHPPGTPFSAANSVLSASDYPAEVQHFEQPVGGDHLLDNSDFTNKYTESVESHTEDGSHTFIASNFETNQSTSSDQSLLISQQQESMQQEQTSSQSYNANFTDGEVIHDANGSILAVTPKKKKFKMSKTHMCDICNKSFADMSKLELHYKSNHLNDRPYQCDVCEKSFFTKWKLQRHMLSHLEQKPHSCPMCSKSFVERGKLEAHYRTHLGTKPYKCEHCPKAFTVKSQLSIHQRRIHSTDQPFGCLVCGKAFLWKSGLDKHMRKHTREKPYICDACGMKYSNKANLIVHMSKAHNQTYIDKQNT